MLGKEQKEIGTYATTLAEILQSPHNVLNVDKQDSANKNNKKANKSRPLPISSNSNKKLLSEIPIGHMIVTWEQRQTHQQYYINMYWSSRGLNSRSNMIVPVYPYLKFYKDQLLVHKTSPLERANAEFPQIRLRMDKLCNGSMHKMIRIEVWDYSKHFSDSFIGTFEFNLNQAIVCKQQVYNLRPMEETAGEE